MTRFDTVSGRWPAHRFIGASFAAAVACSCAAPAAVQSAPAPASSAAGTIQIVARDQPVGAFLRDLFGRIGRPVVPSSNLTGTVNGVFNGSVQKIYSDISKAFGLVGYYDGAALYVYSANELGVQTIQVPAATASRVAHEMQSRGLTDARDTVRVAGDGSLVASGTPRFIEQVSTLARGGPPQGGAVGAPLGPASYKAGLAGGPPPIQPLEFRVFYLRYAHAEDTTTFAGNQQMTVPGVATILQNLVLDQRPGGSAVAGSTFGVRPIRQSQPRLRGTGLDAIPPNANQTPVLGLPAGGDYRGSSEVLGSPISSLGDSNGLVAPLTQDIVRIEPSAYLNAVVVRDIPERMPAYDSLIRALDVEPQIVEVDATIIDIDTQKAQDLGINWRLTTGGFGALFGNGTDSDLGLLPTNGSRRSNVNNITPSGMGGTISAIIGNHRQFLARLTALETKHVARVISRPQVMTLSNVDAVFDRSRTFYVRVAGDHDVDLFNVTAGTIMRVNPHVFRDHDQTRIRVSVVIQDGSISEDEVKGIPIVDQASVTNETMMLNGQSLLLGGMTIDEDTDVEYKIPLLGDIPLLGNLFKSRNKSHGHIERLFLITPHVVSLGTDVGPTTVMTSQVPAQQMTPSASIPLSPGSSSAATPPMSIQPASEAPTS